MRENIAFARPEASLAEVERAAREVGAHEFIVRLRGRVVEHGTHDELMARGGHYHGLYTMQWRGSGMAAD